MPNHLITLTIFMNSSPIGDFSKRYFVLKRNNGIFHELVVYVVFRVAYMLSYYLYKIDIEKCVTFYEEEESTCRSRKDNS